MKLVVGLGNPGRKYEGTRHNIGFEVIGELAKRFSRGAAKSGFQGEVADAELRGVRTMLLCPHTFMNRSGVSVAQARDFYKLVNDDLLIVCDDFNLPLAKLRFRAQGSSGGQKGLEDIIRALGGDAFPRLRVGVGGPPAGWDPINFVLGRFTKQERVEIDIAVVRAADAVADWATTGIETVMNRYNG